MFLRTFKWDEWLVMVLSKGSYITLIKKPIDTNKLKHVLIADTSQAENKKYEIWLQHRRLWHTSFGHLKKLFPDLFKNFDISTFRCEVCEFAKRHCASFPLTLNRSPLSFMIIHSNVWGTSKVATLSGYLWFVTFIGNCSRMTWLCLIKFKDEVKFLFQKFYTIIETQYDVKIRVLHSDNGGDYQSNNLKEYLERHGINHQMTCSHTPQQNGVVDWRIGIG